MQTAARPRDKAACSAGTAPSERLERWGQHGAVKNRAAGQRHLAEIPALRVTPVRPGAAAVTPPPASASLRWGWIIITTSEAAYKK